MDAVPTILYLISLCLFIVYICNRRQQTVSNAYHSSAAYERSTGDPAIGHGFGAAALRSNASHLFTSLFPRRVPARKEEESYSKTLLINALFYHLSVLFSHSYENFDSGHSAKDDVDRPGLARVTLA